MVFESYRRVKEFTRIQCGPHEVRYHYVKLPSEKWCRTYGPPGSYPGQYPKPRHRQLAARKWEHVGERAEALPGAHDKVLVWDGHTLSYEP